MPIKFKSSVKNPKTRSVQNYYMRSTPQAELVETLNATNTTPKRKQQIRNELVKRGVYFFFGVIEYRLITFTYGKAYVMTRTPDGTVLESKVARLRMYIYD